jgi:hypothetical protein
MSLNFHCTVFSCMPYFYIPVQWFMSMFSSSFKVQMNLGFLILHAWFHHYFHHNSAVCMISLMHSGAINYVIVVIHLEFQWIWVLFVEHVHGLTINFSNDGSSVISVCILVHSSFIWHFGEFGFFLETMFYALTLKFHHHCNFSSWFLHVSQCNHYVDLLFVHWKFWWIWVLFI